MALHFVGASTLNSGTRIINLTSEEDREPCRRATAAVAQQHVRRQPVNQQPGGVGDVVVEVIGRLLSWRVGKILL